MNISKPFIISIIISLFFGASAMAQTGCTVEQTESKEHAWKKVSDAQGSGISPQILQQEKSIVKTIADLVMAAYPHPKGCSPEWYGNHLASNYASSSSSKAYSFQSNFKLYLCANNKEILSSGTDNWLVVNMNSLGILGGIMKLNGKEYRTAKPKTEVKDGFAYYQLSNEYDYTASEAWLLTYPDRLPFTALTRKEYIVEAKADLNTEMQGMLKSTALSYPKDPQRKDEALANVRKNYEKVFAVYDHYLNDFDENYLSQPAIVIYGTYGFKGFEQNEKDINKVMLIRENPDYYNKNMPATSPQYITVHLKHSKKGKVANEFYNSIRQNLKLEDLAALLGK